MSRIRFSLLGLLSLIALAAIFFAAIAAGTVLWLQIVFICTLTLLLVAAMLAYYHQGPQRAVYSGFAIFGGSYFLLTLATFFGAHTVDLLPSNIALDLLPLPRHIIRAGFGSAVESPDRYIFHFGAALIFGVVGGLIGDAVWQQTKK